LGIGDHPSLPAAMRSQSFEGLDTSPANLQLMPMMAIGVERDIWQAWGRVPLVAAECTPFVVISDMLGCDTGERNAPM